MSGFSLNSSRSAVDLEGDFQKIHEGLEPAAVPLNMDADLECGDYDGFTMLRLHVTTVEKDPQVLPEASLESCSSVPLAAHPAAVRARR